MRHKMHTQKYGRKAFVVDAVQVTPENMAEVAEWCDGEIRSKKRRGKAVKFIKIDVHRPLNEKQTEAFVSDWVLFSLTGYKVYTDRAFVGTFQLKGPEVQNLFDLHEDETEPVQEPSTSTKLGFNTPTNLMEN